MPISPDFGFVGRLCLNLTVTGDMGDATRFERLTSPKQLQRWLSPLRLAHTRTGPADVKAANALRGAIWRVAGTVLAKTAPRDVPIINRVAHKPALARELLPGAESMRWRCPTAAAALATIAQDAVLLLGDPIQRARIHRCENPKCRVVFYDDSRPGLRRWCAPNRCGDRIRVKLYRDRHRITCGGK
ncbi:MAG TPA: CGNR zinc finger domain-containing protein [Bryobacteraceae bacterium]|nr:CGNR zinc finger domain-containing protein [Bryobacteraceae bacterium]